MKYPAIMGISHLYVAALTDKGKLFVEGWKKGDQRAEIELPSSPKEKDHAS